MRSFYHKLGRELKEIMFPSWTDDILWITHWWSFSTCYITLIKSEAGNLGLNCFFPHCSDTTQNLKQTAWAEEMTHYKWFSTNLRNAHQKTRIYKLLNEKNQMIVLLMNKLGELSDTEGSIKSFAVSFEFCFTLGVTKCGKSVRPGM